MCLILIKKTRGVPPIAPNGPLNLLSQANCVSGAMRLPLPWAIIPQLISWSAAQVRHRFFVDVKGLYKKNFWAVNAKKSRENLFYIFAFVPDIGPNRFFVLKQIQVNRGIDAENDRARLRAVQKGRSIDKPDVFTGIGWKDAEKFENNWNTLPT